MMRTETRWFAAAVIAAAFAAAPVIAASASTAAYPEHHGTHRVAKARHTTRQALADNQVRPLERSTYDPDTSQIAAPVPNENVAPPISNADQHTTVAPTVMQIQYPALGDGFIPGSSATDMDNDDAAQFNGVKLHVPLAQ